MASGGYGRGGRGNALIQALAQAARKPGEDTTQAPSSGGDAQPAPGQPRPEAPVGRGAFLQSLMLQQQAQQPSVGGRGALGAAPMGRGLAALNAALQAAGTSLPPTARGMALSQVQTPQVAPAQPSPPPRVQEAEAVRPKTSPPRPSGDAAGVGAAGEGSTGPPTGALARMSLQERRDPVHAMGSEGKPVTLSANHIRIKCKNKGVYQYHVDFRPNIDSRGMRIRMVNEHRDVIGFVKAFDGSILYLPIELPQQETVLTSIRHTDNLPISIIIKLTKVLPPESCTQLYNIIFRRIMAILEMVQVGRYYYNPATPSSVPQHKLEVWPGYITAVAEQEGGLLLLADASHRVLRTETVLDVMQSIVQRNPQGFRDEVIRTLVGVVVLTRYNNKTYRVDDIVWDKTPTHSFTTTSTGEAVSFVDYYQKSYNIDIRDREQPLLLHRPKKKMEQGGRERKQLEVICLVPELCYMTGLTDALRQDFRVMKDLAIHTRVTPEQRKLTMLKFINAVNNKEEARNELERWGLELDSSTIQFDGRALQPEKIVFGNKTINGSPQADWGREATRENVISAVALRSWVVFYTKRDQTRANDYIGNMMKVCPQMGIDAQAPTRFELRDDRTETFIRALRENINPRIQVVVIICPTSRDDRYSAIKKLCCVECPVPSQVIISKTISKPDKIRSVTQKIALQINCKLGGELWGVAIPLKTSMIIGIDVYHDKSQKKQSIAGFVASTNALCTRWYSRVCIQPASQELIDGLKMCMISAITKYHEVNHKLPDKILVYRDGVGDGQLNTVAGYEVDQLKKCFSHFGEDYNPPLGVVIVQKRINTRIFLKTPRQMENPPPGTIVDHTITRRDWFDFFLVSQHVRQGTVTPTHYIVVHNSSGLKPDHFQKLSYKLTHLYYNWPGTVRVPAPCQYAHKLAYLVGQNVHREPSPELSDRLFFL